MTSLSEQEVFMSLSRMLKVVTTVCVWLDSAELFLELRFGLLLVWFDPVTIKT